MSFEGNALLCGIMSGMRKPDLNAEYSISISSLFWHGHVIARICCIYPQSSQVVWGFPISTFNTPWCDECSTHAAYAK